MSRIFSSSLGRFFASKARNNAIKLNAEAEQKAKAAMKITKADESREAEEALHEGNRRLGSVDAMKVVKILKMTDGEKSG
ncbi:hypothetical protein ISN45_Aa08g016970 [Arabidopsis thaliana x Arabidopsis arenosa]|uniref:Uncharacterized protein n=1 Tax=Arabidopsis thaliana x Arabidopsis arenosa TaxID=1240361 RepID=A0A8T1XSD7_9BRAS|nr:hypothetical protein ISN45_Aa08g016970 [Arabidopsis thaliana x Arabidopsis arenosa]